MTSAPSLQVLHFNTQSTAYFFEDDWLSDKRRRVLLQPGKVGENNVYRVSRSLDRCIREHTRTIMFQCIHLYVEANSSYRNAQKAMFPLCFGCFPPIHLCQS